MNKLKLGVLVCGVIGVAGAFLPYFSGDSDSSLWASRASLDEVRVYLAILGFAVAAAMGVLGVARGMERWKSFVAIVCFAFVILMFRRGVTGQGTPFELFSYAIGAKLVATGALVGIVCAIFAAVRPEPRAAH